MSLQIQEQNNAIIVPLEIKLEKLNELQKIVSELKSVDIASLESAAGQGSSEAEVEKIIKKHLGKLKVPTNVGEATDVMQIFANPKGFILGLVSNPYVASALIAAGLGSQLLNWLMVQGNILDRHFKRIIAEEQIAGIRREERKQTQIGLGRNVIITSHSGSTEPEYSFNSFEARRTGEIDSMTAFQIRRGYKF